MTYKSLIGSIQTVLQRNTEIRHINALRLLYSRYVWKVSNFLVTGSDAKALVRFAQP